MSKPTDPEVLSVRMSAGMKRQIDEMVAALKRTPDDLCHEALSYKLGRIGGGKVDCGRPMQGGEAVAVAFTIPAGVMWRVRSACAEPEAFAHEALGLRLDRFQWGGD